MGKSKSKNHNGGERNGHNSDGSSSPVQQKVPEQNGNLRNGSIKKESSKSAAQTSTEQQQKKKQTFITRTIWTLVMIVGFFVAMFAGHIYLLAIVTGIQIVSFKEVIAVANVPSRERSLRFTKTLNWYFLGTTMYFLYGESVMYYFKHIVMVDKVLLPFATYHRFVSFMLYVIGFVFFVTSLQKGHYRFQFTQFAWTHMALYLIVLQAHFVMNNLFEGLFWVFLPAALVITNDIFAYVCGITFGRTPLIQLSPKKTIEGFVGAWVFTILFGFVFSYILAGSSYFICPVNDLGANIFTGLQCTPNPVFVPRQYIIPHPLPPLPYFGRSILVRPIHFHMLVLATFASLIAPFGGFFASGLKRTFNVKDFGDSIPGHGGMTDRMDCQFIMGFFSHLYYKSFIAVSTATVGGVLQMAVIGLTADEQLDVVRGLGKHLLNQGVISAKSLETVINSLPARR